MSGELYECCKDPANREDGPGPRGGEVAEGLSVTHCQVCGRRHFELTVDPGQLGLKGAAI